MRNNKKGGSIFATKSIRKDRIITYYKVQVILASEPRINNGEYTLTIYDNSTEHKEVMKLVGDISLQTLRGLYRGALCLGHFVNETDKGSEPNCYIDYKDIIYNKKILKVGDILIYKLRASRDIEPEEEITYCYGAHYTVRRYKQSILCGPY